MIELPNEETIVEEVKTFLESHHMLAHREWITGCVEHFVTECDTLTKFKENAYNQWLLNSLSCISPVSLPNNLAALKKTTLNGNYVLQINSVFDISIPAYQQYLKLKNTNTVNIEATMNPEEKNYSKRMLKFELTDGHQTLSGMEYEPLSKVKLEDIMPGSKILIKGPVLCRQGMLLLNNSAVEFLGGEVKEILETHSVAAQLALKLNLPVIEMTPNQVTTSITNESRTDGSVAERANDVTDIQPHSRQIINQYSNPGPSNITPTLSHANNKRPLETVSISEKKIKLDEEDFAGDFDEDIMSLDDDDDVLARLPEEAFLSTVEETERLFNGPVITSSTPFVYIKQINELSELQKRGKMFKVKAQIRNVLTKLTMTSAPEWYLKCTIIDGTDCLDVEFSSEILSEFLGYTPDRIIELKKEVASNPGIKSEINQAYAKTAETLRTLYCIMELTMYSVPKITKLISYDNDHTELLKERLDDKDVKMKINALH